MEKLFTLGTSNRAIEEFLEILKFFEIKNVVDVRRWPTSQLFPHFKKENLEKTLKENKISYFHFENLGGYRQEGYEEFMKTPIFKEAIEELIRIVKTGTTVIICAEKFSWKCHRALICQELEKRKLKIVHIIEKDKIWQPKIEPKEIKPICQKGKILKKLKNETKS